MSEKYAVVFTHAGTQHTRKFTDRQNAVQYAGDQKVNGAANVELFESFGTVALEAKVVPLAVSVNGNGTKKPARKAAKSSAKPAPKAKAKAPVKKKAKGAKKKGSSKKGRPKTCIAVDCRKKNKGPRFKFLCPEHIGASDKQVEKWKAAK